MIFKTSLPFDQVQGFFMFGVSSRATVSQPPEYSSLLTRQVVESVELNLLRTAVIFALKAV